jgi:hypothetical protein
MVRLSGGMKKLIRSYLLDDRGMTTTKTDLKCVNISFVLTENLSDINESPILLNADKHDSRFCYQMNSKYIVMIAVIAATLAGTTVITADNVFAYERNQAISQTNACGNDELPLNVGCQNIDSQVQGDENVIALGAAQVFPEIHHEEPEPPKPAE